MAIEQRTPFCGDQPIAAPVNGNNTSINRNVNVPSERKQKKGWERQQVPNLFSNKNVLVCFPDPIDSAHIGPIAEYSRLLEGLVERRCDGRCVSSNPELVELHPLSEARDKRIYFRFKLSCAQEVARMISHNPLMERMH